MLHVHHAGTARGFHPLPAAVPPAAEDIWHVFNLIREGDRVTATTFRKVAVDKGTGADSERIKLKLTLEIENIEFDAEGRHRACGTYLACADPSVLHADSVRHMHMLP